ncbi:hypothetical protein Ccrd_018085 [Cynara cardunculus var. scolymus]|uniref:Uncharacterized protein n=1 Tax=Cynara cardunculus var. scolymus TaxID=59895 RepID=A0A103Y6W6_CYNCS|nr:hypothetical protein Ccrd_018085 [Cynara cardunculus var. scolymus]
MSSTMVQEIHKDFGVLVESRVRNKCGTEQGQTRELDPRNLEPYGPGKAPELSLEHNDVHYHRRIPASSEESELKQKGTAFFTPKCATTSTNRLCNCGVQTKRGRFDVLADESSASKADSASSPAPPPSPPLSTLRNFRVSEP